MSSTRNKNENIIFICGIVMIVLSVCITVFASVKEAKHGNKSADYRGFSDGWVCDDGTIADLNKLTKDCRIYKVIREAEGQTILFFNARNVDVDVYIDDTPVYKHKFSEDTFLKRFYGLTSGSDFVEIPIYEEYIGKTIYIDVHNPYANTNVCKITDMYYGDGVNIIKHNVTSMVSTFCFCIVIIFLGLTFIVLYFPLAKKKIVGREMFYLGLAAFSTGICMVTDCRLFQVAIGHESLYYTVSQLFMSLIPLPLLLFFGGLYDSFNKLIVSVIGYISAVVFLVCFFLNAFGIKDYHEMAAVTLLMIIVVIGYIIVVTIKDILQKKRNLFWHNVGAIMFACAAILDAIMGGIGLTAETSFFTKFGIAGFMCMECAQVLRNHILNYEKGLHAQFVGSLAYYDGLTNLLNRTSFMEDMDNLEHEENDNLLITMFDINNLKYVNDNFGHTTGDEMIITVAEAIDDFFGDIGKCYRIGGDEIVLIAKGKDIENKYVALQSKFIRHILQLDEKTDYPLSVAVGYAVRTAGHESVKDILDEADARMYENKKDMKKRMQKMD